MIEGLTSINTSSAVLSGVFGVNTSSSANSSSLKALLSKSYDVENLQTGDDSISFDALLASAQQQSLNFSIYTNNNSTQSLLENFYLQGSTPQTGTIYDSLL